MARPTFDPLADGFFEDPYAQYARLREENPVHTDDRGVVFCFAYDDVRRVLIDPRSTSMDRQRALPGSSPPPTFPLSLINRDPPDHTRLRRLLSQAFTQRRIDSLVVAMERQLDRLLDHLEQRYVESGEPVDLVSGLAFPFPFNVISDLLGMPEGMDSQVRGWAHAISIASDPMVTRAQVATAVEAYRAINDYVAEEVLPRKRAERGDDLLSDLIEAEDGDALSRAELLDHVGLLYVAGHETTSGLLGNAILSLVRNRSQLDALRADPGLLPNAIEELNRYDSSVQFAWRYVLEDLPLREVTVPAGTMAFVSCGSANRDPEHFGETADDLDIKRPEVKDLLSFGAGMHFCLGAHLARREAALVVVKLFERFPDLALAGEPSWSRRVTFRSPEHLPVTLRDN